MKVLDINPTCCWSFYGRDEKTINLLRKAVTIEDPQLREHALRSIPNGKAFGFVGDVTRLDFASRFFDKVNVNFAPDFSQRGQLHQCVRRWSKKVCEPASERSDPPFSSRLSRVFAQLTPKLAT